MSEHCIMVEAAPQGEWQQSSSIQVMQSRYYDGVANCPKCKQVLKFMLKGGVFTSQCCGLHFRASEKS